MGSPIPRRKLGGREVKEAKEVSESLLLFGLGQLNLFEGLSIAGCNSCMVAAIFGTFNKFFKLVWLRGPLPNDHKSGRISLGMPPPRSDIRIMTCCGASHISTSIGGEALVDSECFSTTACNELRNSSPTMYCRCVRIYGKVASK